MMEKLTIYWNTKLLGRYPGYLERIRKRFGITKGMTVNGETVDVPSGKDNYWTVSTDGTVKTLTSDNTYTFKNTGNNPTLMIFFETYAPHLDDGTGEVKEGDTIDIYAEKNADRVVENFGATGIYFDMSDVDENGYIELRGDAQPLGYIKLKISVDKAQA